MDAATLERARAGDEDAFRRLTAPHRAELHVHCYRMLGSLTDADDVLQEVLLAAWRGLGGFAGRSSLRTWLYRIATNRCLNEMRAARRRRRPEPVPPFDPPEPTRRGEVVWVQPYPDSELPDVTDPAPGPAARYGSREAVELAFIVAVQRLPPRQIAVLLLCDVLAFSLPEVAAMLGTTATAVKGVLQRARGSFDVRLAEDRTPRARPARREEAALARRFADAFSRDDVDGVVALLTDDAWLAMPPAPHEYQGREAIAAFLHASQSWRSGRRLELVATRANTQPAFACYVSDVDRTCRSTIGMVVLTVSGDRIVRVTRFLDDRLAARFVPAPACT